MLREAVQIVRKFAGHLWGVGVMNRLSVKHRHVLQELRPLATAFEHEISPLRAKSGATFNILRVTEDGLTLNDDPESTHYVASCSLLHETLHAMGVKQISLDVQLEEGQVTEAVLLLFHAHIHLRSATAPTTEYKGWRASRVAGQMLTDVGFHRFCFLLQYDREHDHFSATYSYCELPLSIFVQHYVQRHAKYGDHRVLFRAAPRVGLLAFFLVLLPTLLYIWYPMVAIVLFCGLGVIAALAAAVTMYALGSIQYTREHHDVMMQRYVAQIEKLSRFPEANPNIVMELSPEGVARYINPAGKQLLEALSLSEEHLDELLSSGYRDLVRDSLETPGRTFRDETTADNRTFNCHYVSFPKEDSVILAGTEITYLKKIESDLREANILSEAQKEQIAAAYRLLDAEFEIIGNIQRSLLPGKKPVVAGLDIATHYETCQRAGGDYYDFFPLRNGNLGILIADVSGHGSPAAVLMAITHTIAHILHEEPLETGPENAIAYINRNLARHYEHRGDFVTAIYGVYDPSDRSFRYSSAGHNPPMVAEAQGNSVRTLEKQGGLPLGIMEEVSYEASTVNLEIGQTLLLYTDGITEAMDCDQNLFGDDRMAAAIGDDKGATEQVADLLKQVREFVGNEPLNDDRTVVLLRGVERIGTVSPYKIPWTK